MAEDRGLYSRINKSKQVRWYVRIALNGQMRHFGSFQNKSEARAFYQRAKGADRERKLRPGQIASVNYTIPELFAAYLPQADHRLAFREQLRFALWWTAYWPRQTVFEVTPMLLEQARRELRRSGRQGHRSEGTVNHYLKCLKHAMRALVQPRSWVVDLWSQVKLERPDGKPPVPISEADEVNLARFLSEDDVNKVRLALVTGLRRAQLFSRRWEQILWKEKALALQTVKKQRPRYLPLPDEAMAMLKAIWSKAAKPTSGWIFPRPENPALHEDPGSWYKYRFMKALKLAGLADKGLTFHSTRHAFAVRFLEAGGHARALQRAGGWSSLSQVERYTQIEDESLRAAMNRAANSRKLQKQKAKFSNRSPSD